MSFGLLQAVVLMGFTVCLFAYVGFRCVRLSFLLGKAQSKTLVCTTESGKSLVSLDNWWLLWFGLFLWGLSSLLVTVLITALG